MDKGSERKLKQKEKDRANGAKPDGKKPIADGKKPIEGEQQKEPWPPSGGPGERSDKDAIGRPVQLDQD